MIEISNPQAGTYVIGATRSGKSSFLAHRILIDAKAGKGLVLVDPKGSAADGSLADLVAGYLPDATILDVESATFGLDLFACSNPADPKAVETTTDSVMEVFTRTFDLSREGTPRLRAYLRNSAIPLIVASGELASLPDVLTDPGYRAHLLSKLPTSYKEVHRFWKSHEELTRNEKQNRIESTNSRVGEFLGGWRAKQIFSRQGKVVDWVDVLRSRRVVIVRLAPSLSQLSNLVGAVVMAQLAGAGFSRRERTPFAIYCDEYQRFATPATDELLTMGGGFGLETTIAHQFRSQLDATTKGATLQAGNLIVFRVSSHDADELAGMFRVPEEEPRVISRMARLAVAHAPVGSLLSGKHGNDRVRGIVEQHLRPLANAYDVDDYQRDKWRRHSYVLDRYLVDLMEGTLTQGSEEEGDRLGQVVFLLGDLSNVWQPFWDCYRPAGRVFLSGDEGGWEPIVRRATEAWAQEERRRVAEQRECETPDLDYKTLTPVQRQRKYEAFQADQKQREDSYRYSIPLRAMEQELRVIKVIGEEQYRERLAVLDERDRAAGVVGLAKAREAVPLFRERFVSTAAWVAELGHLLAAELLMVQTELFDPTHERSRSVADRVEDFANQLPGLPLGTAWVKLWRGDDFLEEEVTFPPPPEPNGFVFVPLVEDEEEAEESVFYELDEDESAADDGPPPGLPY